MWLSFAFLSAALLGCYDIFKKRALRDNAVVPVLFLNTLFCSLIFVPLIVGSAAGWIPAEGAGYIPLCGWATHRLVLVKAFIVLGSWLLGYVGMKHLPLTIVGPINATRPVLTLVGAMCVYGERLNGWQWTGVLLAVVSFLLLSRSGKKEGIRFLHNRWIYCIVGAALLGAASGLYDKYLMAPVAEGGAGLDKMVVQSWYNLYQCAMKAVMLAVLWWPGRRTSTPFRWSLAIPMISVFLTAADLAYFYALSQPGALISVVSMVRRGSVVVSFLGAALLFKERNLKSKAVDLALVLLGMVCLWIGTA